MAIDPNISWRFLTIEEAVNNVVQPLIERGLATERRGASEKEIIAAEGRLGRPLPDDLRFFFLHVTPVPESPLLGGGFVGFQPIGDPDLTWLDDPDLREEKLWVCPSADCWLDGWQTARLLVVGYTDFGDWLLWCDGLSNRATGTIVLTDHEGENNPIVLGDSLAQWLGRYSTFGFIEYSIAEGGLEEIEWMAAELFLRDHLRLNPQCQWAKKMLRRKGGTP
jgi:hypothetical protein